MPVCVESMTYAATQVNLMFSVWLVVGELCGIFVGHETPSVDLRSKLCGVSGQAAQPVLLASLKLSMAVYGQKLDGRPSR